MLSKCSHSRYTGTLHRAHLETSRRWGAAVPTSRPSWRRCALTRQRPQSRNNERLKNAETSDEEARAAWQKQLTLKRDLVLAVGSEDYRLAAFLKKEITELDATLPEGVVELVVGMEKLNAAATSQDKLDALVRLWSAADEYRVPDFLEERCMQSMQSLFPAPDSPVESNIQREFLGLMLEDDVLLREDGVLEELLELMAVIKLEGAKVMYDVIRLKQQQTSRKVELERLRLLAVRQNLSEVKTAWLHFKQHRLPYVSLTLVAVLTLIEAGAVRFLPMQPYSAAAVGITLCLSSRWFLNVMMVAAFKVLYGKDLQAVLGWVPEKGREEDGDGTEPNIIELGK